MKISAIQADKFMRLDLVQLDLSGATAHLFCGPNESGKSSLQEAVRFALLGETARLSKSTKAARQTLIRDGAKNGSVSVTVDDTAITRDIKTGAEPDPDHPYHPHQYLPFLLDAQRFALTNAGTRRSMLMKLTGTEITGDSIIRRMIAKGCDAELAEQIKPMLRSGFDATHKEAQNNASSVRSQWCGLTGQQRYGRIIATDWKPEPPEGFDPAALLEIDGEIDALTTQKSVAENARGKAQGRLEDAEIIYKAQQDAAEFDPAELEKVEAAIQVELNEWKHHDEAAQRLNAQISNAREKAPVTCCECGAMIRVKFESSPTGTKGISEPYKPMDAEEVQKLTAELMQHSDAAQKAKRQANALEDEANTLREKAALATGGRKPVTAAAIQSLKDEITNYSEAVEHCTKELAELDAKARKLREAAVLVKNAKDIEKRATALHQLVEKWERIVSVLAPDGIPAEILADALTPVNNRLRETAIATGWPQISIDPTMEVLADGRSYNLLSESAKWRADAAIAEAISHLSGLKLLVLDRIDVLDIPGRGKLINWIGNLVDSYDSILLFGTLKAKPAASTLPPGMDVYWLQAGNIQEAA